DEGNTVTDFMPQERERGITIQSAAVTTSWAGHQINLIDTPGHIDFTAEVQRSLRVLDGGVVVFDGVSGVEPQSETVWHQADIYRVPRICFVNKMDRTGANLDNAVAMIVERLHAHPVVVQLPIGRESGFRGVIDLVHMQAIVFDGREDSQPQVESIPAELRAEAEHRHDKMLEALADVDDAIAVSYLDQEPISTTEIVAALRKATCNNRAVPVLCGSALRNTGMQPLLDAVVAYLPSPLDVEPMRGHTPAADELIDCLPDVNEPVAALIFKISTDAYVGKLAFVRVYSGTLRRGATALDAATGKTELVGRLVRMHADRREEVEEIYAGDIGAILGLKMARTGQTLSSSDRPVVLEEISFPAPVIEIAVAPKSQADQDKMGIALQRLCEEDPTLHVTTSDKTGQTVLAGMGELHLDVIVDRLRREFGVDATVGAPRVAYVETITRPVRAEGRLVKQSGGHGQFAVIEVEFEPLEAGAGFVFENGITKGVVPKEYIPAVEHGIRDALAHGPVSRHPVVDLKARLVDGKYHEVDSSEQAFYTAGILALKAGVLQGAPAIMEPMMKLVVVTPQDYTGNVIGELSQRAATVTGIEPRTTGIQSITADVPLARMFGYATGLRSNTQGRATFTMSFSHYQRVNEETRKELVTAAA
ncbi:MAG: elongation factor G, partial [Chloroflexi bacterium]|nr:elongation factor G [Chloroflexota bacterium]